MEGDYTDDPGVVIRNLRSEDLSRLVAIDEKITGNRTVDGTLRIDSTRYVVILREVDALDRGRQRRCPTEAVSGLTGYRYTRIEAEGYIVRGIKAAAKGRCARS